MKAKSRLKYTRLASVLMAAVLVFVFASPARAETPSEKYERLKGELEAIGDTIDDYKGQKAYAVQAREARETEKAILDEMIVLKRQEIAETELALEQKQIDIAEKRQTIMDNDQLLQQRLLAVYHMKSNNTLATLLSVNSFSEFMVLSDGLRRISKEDTDLLDMLSEQKTQLEAEELDLQGMLAGLENAYAELEENARILAENIAALNDQISAADAALLAQQQAYDEKKLERDAAYKAMLAFVNSIGGGSKSGDGTKYEGGVMAFPVGSNNVRFTTEFGQGGHGGLDISTQGVSGVAALAAADGKIIQAGWHDHQYSYGNYVVIDHGGGVRTLYAHLDSISVSSGSVTRGQQIGTVGNTGYSFGIHLHFEVHQDGVRQNPRPYIGL